MGRIAPDILEEIKDRIDIVQLISQYLPLKRAGRNFKALCPFHTEKTPSFTVSPEKQFFHCFGCGASGDIFQFLMRMENVTFPEALERLAEQAGVEIPGGRGEDGGEERDRLYHLHREAADYFREVLLSSSGKKAREVAMSRGLDSSAIEAFRLGYAPDSWDRLREELKSKGFTTAEMLSVGLLGEREGGGEPYVKFRHRLMIPIWDSRGRVVAFGGRALEPEQEPKYLNSPEHLLFKKGDILYPYHMARKAVRDMGYVLLVEGYMDAITCHLHGFSNALAALGTALTPSQARKVVRLSKEVVLAYDGDEAGRKAALRAASVFFQVGVVPRVVLLPSGEDPDSLLRSRGREAFASLISGAEDVVLWYMAELETRYSLSHPRERARWLKEVLGFLAPLRGSLDLESYLVEVASKTGVTLEGLKMEIYGRGKGGARSAPHAPRGSWEVLYLALALSNPRWWKIFKGEVLEDPLVLSLWEKVKGEDDPSIALAMLDDSERSLLVGKVMEIPEEGVEELFASCHRRAERRALEREARRLKMSMEGVSGEEKGRLLARYIEIMKSIKGAGEEGVYETH